MKLRFGSMLLWLKLTLTFVLFGLIVGYASHLVTSLSNAKLLVDSIVTSSDNPIENIIDSFENDWILSLYDRNNNRDTIKVIMDTLVPVEFRTSINLQFFYRDLRSREWYLVQDTGRKGSVILKADVGITDLLSQAAASERAFSNRNIFNMDTIHSIFINMTQEGDTHEYVLKVDINRDRLINLVRENSQYWVVYTPIILTISVFLGGLFAKTISKPLRLLSGKAVALSRGNLKVRFRSKRMDDIGILYKALNRMAINIENRIKTMETMNRIDKAVNSSMSRDALLKEVSGSIYDQFPDAVVVVLERGLSSYRVLAAAPEHSIDTASAIPFTELPDRVIFNDYNVSPLNKEGIRCLNSIFPGLERNTGISIPLVQSDHIVGFLVVMKKSIDESEIEYIKMLADQVSVALLSIKEVEDREGMYNAMLLSLTRSVDAKSKWTAGHSERVTVLSLKLAEKLGLSSETKELIRIAALLHDIGKLGIPEAILDKPGKLTAEEYNRIKEHPSTGEEIIEDVPHFEMVRTVIRHHHERWDGKGYPDGLTYDNIPLAARIVTIADVWDSITADRPYREGFSFEKSIEIMKEEREHLFDPGLLDLFLELILDEDNR